MFLIEQNPSNKPRLFIIQGCDEIFISSRLRSGVGYQKNRYELPRKFHNFRYGYGLVAAGRCESKFATQKTGRTKKVDGG